jgi:hypothetical protein
VISSIGISSQKKNGKEKAFMIPAEAFLPESKNAFFHYITTVIRSASIIFPIFNFPFGSWRIIPATPGFRQTIHPAAAATPV